MATPAPQTAPVLSIKDWLITFLILCIPIVGFIMSIVWAVNHENVTKRNFFRATWILTAILMVFYIILLMFMGAALVGAGGGY